MIEFLEWWVQTWPRAISGLFLFVVVVFIADHLWANVCATVSNIAIVRNRK